MLGRHAGPWFAALPFRLGSARTAQQDVEPLEDFVDRVTARAAELHGFVGELGETYAAHPLPAWSFVDENDPRPAERVVRAVAGKILDRVVEYTRCDDAWSRVLAVALGWYFDAPEFDPFHGATYLWGYERFAAWTRPTAGDRARYLDDLSTDAVREWFARHYA